MAEFSFDVVSQVDLQEVDNAVQQSMKEILQRYDFKGSKSKIDLDKTKNEIVIVSDDDYKMKAVVDVFQGKLIKRGISLKNIEWGTIEPSAQQTVRQTVKIKQGLAQDKAKDVVKAIKDGKYKVQVQIQGEQLRVSSKSKDDLQTVMAMIRQRDFGTALQFTNYR